MIRPPPPWFRPAAAAAILLAAGAGGVLGQQVVLPPGFGGQPGGGPKPGPAYDLAQQALAAGDVTGGLELATREYQSCTRIGAQRWVDSIAAAAILGECLFESGRFRDAAASYEEAFSLAAVHPDWLLSVQFPQVPLRPVPPPRVATWARSSRNTAPAAIPDTVSIRQRGADPQEVLQRGGVLSAPVDVPIRAQEIMRALVIAIYRHGSLLGDLASETASLERLAAVLARRPAPPNHYSQAWVEVALGTAQWARGAADKAAPLVARGLLAGEGLDHALTAWGLIVLGRIALDADQAAVAARHFEEAALVAGEFGDARAIEEAFRLSFMAHMAAGTRGVPASIRDATVWTANQRAGLAVAHARLLAMQAEALALAGDVRGAARTVAEIDGRLLAGDPGRGGLGAQAAYAKALCGYAAGDGRADADLAAACEIARTRSPRLFQTELVTGAVASNSGLTDRRAEEVFAKLLAPARPRDFAIDPLESLAIATTARAQAFDAWLLVALRRHAERQTDLLLDVSEAATRDRWLWAQPLGGRRLATERLLASAPDDLPPADAARRATILGDRRDLAPLLDRMARLRGELAAPAGGDAAAWAEYRNLAEVRGRLVAAIAAGREPVTADFPPLTPAADIRARLRPRQLILSFHAMPHGLFAALESNERFVVWEVRQAAGIPAELKALARSFCLFGSQSAVGTDKLLASDWRASAVRLERMLFENSKVTLSEGIDELVIVPDGWLWYLPFELLPVSSARIDAGDGPPRLLRDACRVRYCPTRSLAVMPLPAVPRNGPIGVQAGRLNAGDTPADAAALATAVSQAVDRAVPLAITPGGPPPALLGSIYDAIAFFDEVTGDGPIASRTLAHAAGGKGGLTFADWLAPPLKRPRLVLLPGLQTAVADGLDKRLPARPGDDVFVAATDLLAAGAGTALVSRWRAGGAIGTALMTEFLRDATGAAADEEPPPASESWRRAVDLVTAERPDPDREPRLRQQGDAVLDDARHPIFWAGYLLVDCGSGRSPQPPVPGPPAVPGAAPQPAAGAAR
jgi:tetratricopeptide (TPR) repeat protein